MQSTAKKLCSQAFNFGMLIHTTYAAYSPKALSSLLLVDAYSQSICSLQSKNSVKPFTCGCLFTKHMQPTVQKLCQAFYLWMLIHKAYAAYSPKTLSSLSLVDAYSQSQSICTYSQSICSLQPKSSAKPFTCGCLFTKPKHMHLFTKPKHMHLFTKHMQPTAQKLSQAFYMWMLIHKAKAYALIHKAKAYALIHKAYAAYSPKAQPSLLHVDAYSQSQSICTYSQSQSICTYSQSICSLQPKSSAKPFTCGCLFTKPKHMHLFTKPKHMHLFTKHMQPTAQKLSQAFYMWMLIHKAKACAAYSPKAQPSLLLVDAYSQSQSMCSLQPKSSSVKPFV